MDPGPQGKDKHGNFSSSSCGLEDSAAAMTHSPARCRPLPAVDGNVLSQPMALSRLFHVKHFLFLLNRLFRRLEVHMTHPESMPPSWCAQVVSPVFSLIPIRLLREKMRSLLGFAEEKSQCLSCEHSRHRQTPSAACLCPASVNLSLCSLGKGVQERISPLAVSYDILLLSHSTFDLVQTTRGLRS